MALEGEGTCSSEREERKGGGVKTHLTQAQRRVEGPHLQTFSSAGTRGRWCAMACQACEAGET